MQNGHASYGSFKTVTASDTTLLNCRALLINVTVAGNIVFNPDKSGTTNNTTVTFSTGTFIVPIHLDQGRVMSTGFTATATVTALA